MRSFASHDGHTRGRTAAASIDSLGQSQSRLKQIKKWLRAVFPESILEFLARFKSWIKLCHARLIFMSGHSKRPPLDISRLEDLCSRYEEPSKVRYDPAGLEERAEQNVERLLKTIPPHSFSRALELGCWDGMVCSKLMKQGKECVGLDFSRAGFDSRAREKGVCFIQGDATAIPFASGSFDLVFSFSSFEHFARPETVVKECARVLRPKGKLFLEFGPIAHTPYGLHAYRTFPLPYVDILFRVEDLKGYAREKSFSADWPFINGVSVEEYRKIFRNAESSFSRIGYQEFTSGGMGAELIATYPDIFRSVSSDIDSFLVSGMMICLERH